MQAQRQQGGAQQEVVAARSMVQQLEQECAQLKEKLSNVEVELDVTRQARRDEWQQRNTEVVEHDEQKARITEQLVSLQETVTKLEQSLESKDKELELAFKSQEIAPSASASEIPPGPLSSLERDRIMALEQELQDARNARREATTEIARLKSRLQVADDECKIMTERLDLATASLANKEAIQKSAELLGAALPRETDAARAAMIEALTADVEALRREKAELAESLRQQGERSSQEVETSKRKAEAMAHELEHAQAAAQAEVQRARHDVDLAKKIAHEREVAIDDLCAERDHLHSQWQQALQAGRERDRARAVSESADEDVLAGGSAGKCYKCESIGKDNKQLFEDNQKLFRDNKKMAGDVRDLNAKLKESHETARQLDIEVSALTSINNDLSSDRTRGVQDERGMSLENVRLREEAEVLRQELQQLHAVQDLNRTLSENLSALSDEYKTERDANRTTAAATAQAMEKLKQDKAALTAQITDVAQQVKIVNDIYRESKEDLEAQKATLDKQVAGLKDDLQVLRAVKKTRGVAQTTSQSVQTDELPPAHPVETGPREVAALPEPVQLTMTLGMDFDQAGEEGSAEREAFKRDVAADLAKASGLPPDNFQITKISAGSVILDMDIMPDPLGVAPAPSAIALDLEKQAADPNSPLRSGKLTSHTKGIKVLSSPPSNQSQARALAPDPPGWSDHVESMLAPDGTPAQQEMANEQHSAFAPGFDPSPVQLKRRAVPKLGASAPRPSASGGHVGDGELDTLRVENNKLLEDNKRMFTDCQQFVQELQELQQDNAQLVLGRPRPPPPHCVCAHMHLRTICVCIEKLSVSPRAMSMLPKPLHRLRLPSIHDDESLLRAPN